LASANKTLLRVKGAYPFSSQNVVDAQIKVEELQDAIKRLEALQTELF
jgi:hypothetical protein